jgi:hypothetical protein
VGILSLIFDHHDVSFSEAPLGSPSHETFEIMSQNKSFKLVFSGIWSQQQQN